jgi:hypothetical protein
MSARSMSIIEWKYLISLRVLCPLHVVVLLNHCHTLYKSTCLDYIICTLLGLTRMHMYISYLCIN